MSDQTTTDTAPPEQPDGIADDSYDLPDPARAAQRVGDFLSAYGDGLIEVEWSEGYLARFGVEAKPLYARDLEALSKALAAKDTEVVKLNGLLKAALASAARTYEQARDDSVVGAEESARRWKAERDRVNGELAATCGELAGLKARAFVLPVDWREQIDRANSIYDIPALVESWSAPAVAGLHGEADDVPRIDDRVEYVGEVPVVTGRVVRLGPVAPRSVLIEDDTGRRRWCGVDDIAPARPAPTPIEEFFTRFPEVANASVSIWVCPDERHRDKGIVQWRGDVAHCMEDGCGRNSAEPRPPRCPWCPDDVESTTCVCPAPTEELRETR